jgi:SAM-dependent methyltransferase
MPVRTSPEHPTEIARLMLQDRMITEGMGGLFPERSSLENIHSILDVGCGPGGWVLDVAHTSPDRSVIGIDISPTLIAYNQAQAVAQRLSNVSFVVMDALQPLPFEETFDLVNVRFAHAFVPQGQWRLFLQNCIRVLRPGGVLRVTDDEITVTSSPACEKMHFWKSQWLLSRGYGHLGTSPVLGPLLREVGCVHIQFMPHVLDFSTGTALHESQYQNALVWPMLNKSFLIDAGMTTEEEFDQTSH